MTVKYLVVLLVILAVLWSMRSTRRAAERERPPPQKPAAVAHEAMVECAQCHMHLPQSEAVQGTRGTDEWFCGEPHRVQHERVTRS